MGIDQLLRQIERSTLVALEQTREVLVVGPFFVALHPTSDLIWFNYAVPLPEQDAEIHSEDVDRLRAFFRSRGRRLRFEFIERLWPRLGDTLSQRGLNLQGRMPLMACGKDDFRPFLAPDVVVEELRSACDENTLREFILTGKRTFTQDEPTVSPEEMAEQRAYLESGCYRCAYARIGSFLAGVGTLVAGSGELAGVGTLPAFRRQGVAASVSSRLVAAGLAGGASVIWLSAGDAPAVATYRKIGFQASGEQLNYLDEAS